MEKGTIEVEMFTGRSTHLEYSSCARERARISMPADSPYKGYPKKSENERKGRREGATSGARRASILMREEKQTE
eukprot:4775357-Pleurochrysis_carterae.AAC.4